MAMDIKPGNTVKMKKKHPCGGAEFAVLRTGMDFRMKCVTCGREMFMPRYKAEKMIKNVIKD